MKEKRRGTGVPSEVLAGENCQDFRVARAAASRSGSKFFIKRNCSVFPSVVKKTEMMMMPETPGL